MYTRESSVMHCACNMDGSLSIPLKPAAVAPWQFTVDYTMICHMGGFLTICDNEIRDITATLLNNVATEPPLQPLNRERMTARSVNTEDGACIDICARGFWNVSQDAFFDVRVFYPNASSNCSTGPLLSTEGMSKLRSGSTDSKSGELSVACSPLLSCLQLVAWEGRQQPSTNAWQTQKMYHGIYPAVIGWRRCRLSFASLRASIILCMCIHNTCHHNTNTILFLFLSHPWTTCTWSFQRRKKTWSLTECVIVRKHHALILYTTTVLQLFTLLAQV